MPMLQFQNDLEQITLVEDIYTEKYADLIRRILNEWSELEEREKIISGSLDLNQQKLDNLILYAQNRSLRSSRYSGYNPKGLLLLSIARKARTERQVLRILDVAYNSEVLAQIMQNPCKEIRTSKVVVKIINLLQQHKHDSNSLRSIQLEINTPIAFTMDLNIDKVLREMLCDMVVVDTSITDSFTALSVARAYINSIDPCWLRTHDHRAGEGGDLSDTQIEDERRIADCCSSKEDILTLIQTLIQKIQRTSKAVLILFGTRLKIPSDLGLCIREHLSTNEEPTLLALLPNDRQQLTLSSGHFFKT